MIKPNLFILCGLPGCGKSTVGRMIAERLDAIILQSDTIRRELFPVRTYAPAESKTVYETLLARAEAHLRAGQHVILDATFVAEAHRAEPLALADELGVESEIVHVVSTPELTHSRLSTRVGDPSEATYEIYLQLLAEFEEIKIAHIRIENVGDLAALERAVETYFG